jgi:hypothetical protein
MPGSLRSREPAHDNGGNVSGAVRYSELTTLLAGEAEGTVT